MTNLSNTQRPMEKLAKLGKRASLLLIVPLTLGLAGIAQAHPGGDDTRTRGEDMRSRRHGVKMAPGKLKQCRKEKRAQKIKRFDSDGDGKLSPDERSIARATRKAERLGEYDKDKNGKLDKAERADLIHDRVTEKFEGIDTNGNAEISNSEANKSCTPLGKFFSRVDQDGSDSISWTEFEKVAKKRMKHMKRRRRGMRGKQGRSGQGRGHRRSGDAS
jgi:Ca2+-binding EF-hand superfamily protein